MTQRKAEFRAEDEPQSKRPRIGEGAVAVADDDTASTSLNSVNDDCLLLILKFLPSDDLPNSVAVCSRHCQKARAHESLDQTRKGTINVAEGTRFDTLVPTIVRNGWNEAFQNIRTHLEILGLEKLEEQVYFVSITLMTRSQSVY